MAFCKFCGTKLEDGQLCNCEGAVAERTVDADAQPMQTADKHDSTSDTETVKQAISVQQPQEQPDSQIPNMQYQEQPQIQYQQVQPAITVDTERIVSEAKNSFDNILAVLKAPITGGVAYINGKNYVGSAILIFAQLFITSFFALLYGLRFNYAVDKLADTAGFLGFVVPFESFKILLAKTFFMTFLFAIVTMLLIGGAFFVGSLMIKLDFKITHAINFLGYRAIFTIPATIMAMTLSFLNTGLGIGFFYAIGLIIMGIIVSVLIEMYACKKDEILCMSLIVLVLLVLVFLPIYIKVGLLYVPDINEIIKEIIG